MSPCRAAWTRRWPRRCSPSRGTTSSACRCSSTTRASGQTLVRQLLLARRSARRAPRRRRDQHPALHPELRAAVRRAGHLELRRRVHRGRTPLPCARCNSDLKFATLAERARGFGADAVATGHYARVERDETSGRYLLRRGTDPSKDQAYFLFSLTQDQLARAGFPVGDRPKEAVRDYARARGLPVADKPDSQEICFIPDHDYAAFVARRAPAVGAAGHDRRRERQTCSAPTTASTASRSASARGSASPPRRPARRCTSWSSGRQTRQVVVGPKAALERTTLTASRGELDCGRAGRTAARVRADPPSPSGGARDRAGARTATAPRWSSTHRSSRSRRVRPPSSTTATSWSAEAGSSESRI